MYRRWRDPDQRRGEPRKRQPKGDTVIFYGMDGQQISRDQAIELMESPTARTVAHDERDGVTVSTVLLCVDHSFGMGPPLIFETMIFGGPHNDYQERYATREEAEEGHRRACETAFGQVTA